MYGKIQQHLQNELNTIQENGLFKKERVITSPQGAEITISTGETVLNFCANNYLGLSSHPEVVQAARDALDSHGFGMSSVRFTCGTQDIHKELEQKIISERDFISTIIDNANSVIAVIDNEGRMIRVNKYAQEFTGYTQEQIASEPYFWSRFLPESQKEKVLDLVEEAKKGHIIKSFKNIWVSKDKEERVFE